MDWTLAWRFEMKDFGRGLMVFVFGFVLGCASGIQVPTFGFFDDEGRALGCVKVSETMQRCEFIKQNGKHYWLQMPIIIIEPNTEAPDGEEEKVERPLTEEGL